MSEAKSEQRQTDAARIEVERTRARLMGSAHELQERLSPKTLARGAWEGARDKGADLAEDAVDAVRARPLAAGGAVAAVALFLGREPLIRLAMRAFGSKKTAKRAKPATPAKRARKSSGDPAPEPATEKKS